MKILLTSFFVSLLLSSSLLFAQSVKKVPSKEINGKKVFETYCWGCHHQTAVAFGPSFEEIASKRDTDEIRAMITDPAAVSKIFGYKRNAMRAFTDLKAEELDAITSYIVSFKPNHKIMENK